MLADGEADGALSDEAVQEDELQGDGSLVAAATAWPPATTHRWRGMRFSALRSGGARVAWQAECPYHRRSTEPSTVVQSSRATMPAGSKGRGLSLRALSSRFPCGFFGVRAAGR